MTVYAGNPGLIQFFMENYYENIDYYKHLWIT